jgi:hypothetical protein
VTLPVGSGRRRVKAIRVWIRSTIQLELGGERGREEDVLFEGKVELTRRTPRDYGSTRMHRGGGQGYKRPRATQLTHLDRFEFSLILPSTLAPHDWHPNDGISHDLCAVVEGISDPAAPHSARLFSGRSFHCTAAVFPQTRRTPGLPHPNAHPRLVINPALVTSAHSLSVTRQNLPVAPAYSESQVANAVDGNAGDGTDWLRGTYQKKRSGPVFYIPNPSGGVNTLDDLFCLPQTSQLPIVSMHASDGAVKDRGGPLSAQCNDYGRLRCASLHYYGGPVYASDLPASA